MSGIVAATIGACVTCQLVARVYGARSAIWATMTVWLGSSALYCLAHLSHAASMLTSSVFVLIWLRTRDDLTVGNCLSSAGSAGGRLRTRPPGRTRSSRFAATAVILLVRGDRMRVASSVGPAPTWTICAVSRSRRGALLAISPRVVRCLDHPLWQPAARASRGGVHALHTTPALSPRSRSPTTTGCSRGRRLSSSLSPGCWSWCIRDSRARWRAPADLRALSWYANAAAADWWGSVRRTPLRQSLSDLHPWSRRRLRPAWRHAAVTAAILSRRHRAQRPAPQSSTRRSCAAGAMWRPIRAG